MFCTVLGHERKEALRASVNLCDKSVSVNPKPREGHLLSPKNVPAVQKHKIGSVRLKPAYAKLAEQLMQRFETETLSDLIRGLLIVAAKQEGLPLTGIKEVPTWTISPRFNIHFGRPKEEPAI